MSCGGGEGAGKEVKNARSATKAVPNTNCTRLGVATRAAHRPMPALPLMHIQYTHIKRSAKGGCCGRDVRGCGGHLIMATWCAARIHNGGVSQQPSTRSSVQQCDLPDSCNQLQCAHYSHFYRWCKGGQTCSMVWDVERAWYLRVCTCAGSLLGRGHIPRARRPSLVPDARSPRQGTAPTYSSMYNSPKCKGLRWCNSTY